MTRMRFRKLAASAVLLIACYAISIADAFKRSEARIEYPLMQNLEEFPSWQTVVKEKQKVYNTGEFHYAVNASVLQGTVGGLFDFVMTENLKAVCEGHICKRKVCALARGNWCRDFSNSEPIPWKPAPRGDKECPATKYGTCNGVGVCQYDFGTCMCQAGWKGLDCGIRDPRPCTNRFRLPSDANQSVPVSHVGPDGRDRNWSVPGWTASRCAGYCDEDYGVCYCPPDTRLGRVPAPQGSAPGTPPVKIGRVVGDTCKPSRDPANGNAKVLWGQTDPDFIFGAGGWCDNETKPTRECGCLLDGLEGYTCSLKTDIFCLNQCSGHGECMYGFCKCHLGWYGMDCARRRASSAPIPKAAIEEVIPKHHQNVATFPVAARDPPPAPTRRRPLIYMYDLDPLFNTRMLQYRLVRTSCLHRMFKPDNSSSFVTHGYSIETYFTEVLMTSAHRTYDPEEADFFFVPLLVTCYFWPVLGWSDHPWFGMPLAIVRPHQGAYMYRDAKRWIQQQHPWWDRRGGRDHIWMTAHDEGACWLPTEIYNTSIILTHWGRMDDVHVSGTAWGYDNYSAPLPPWPPHVEGDWRDIYDGHPCYTPGKDLVIPLFKPPGHYAHSPLMGAPPLQRDILLYLRGDTGPYRAHWYSRGIRQRLAKLGYMHDWAEKHRIFVGEQFMIPGTYSEHLARSVFCVVAPGDGYSGRGEDAVLHGCIPLIIMDGVHAVFESIIDWSAFSIRIAESAVNEQLPQFLKSISPAQIELMQRKIAMVWHRFAYTTGPLMQDNLAATYGANRVLRRHVRNLLPVNAVEADTRRTLDTVQRLTRGGMLPVPGWLGLDSIKEQNGTGVAWQGQPDGEWLGPVGHPQRAYRRFPVLNDAWHTILAWLHSRIPSTR